jgi:hypothetical protein
VQAVHPLLGNESLALNVVVNLINQLKIVSKRIMTMPINIKHMATSTLHI